MSRSHGKVPQPKNATEPKPKEDPSLEEFIDQKIGSLVPQQSRAQVVSQITSVVQAEMFSGPIAHPRHLREYEDICPGAADRIIAMAEKRNDHLIAMETRIEDNDERDRRLGMYLGAGAFIALTAGGLIAALAGLGPVTTGLFLGTAAMGAVSRFIKGRKGD